MQEIINVQNLDGQLLVSSREVAVNFEKNHKEVLRSIENIRAQNCAVLEMFTENTYVASNRKANKEYLINRDGFSLLVMGFTGSKALTWKLKYIDAFNKMEQELRNPFSKMSKELQAIFSLDSKQQEQEKRITDIEDKMTIDYELANNLQNAIKRRSIEILGGKDSEAYKKLSKKLFSAFYRDIKRSFKVNSYKNLSMKNYDLAIDYVKNWDTKDEVLIYAIQGLNSQIAFA